MSWTQSTMRMIAGAGLALVMTAGATQAQVASWVASDPSISMEQLNAIRSTGAAKTQIMQQLPVEFDSISKGISSVAAAAGPAAMVSGQGPSGAQTQEARAAQLQALDGVRIPDNYGNCPGNLGVTFGGCSGSTNLNSVFHYNDLLINVGAYFDYPQSASGILWVSSDGGKSYGWCTASLISRSILAAAGHCVRENKTWITNGIYIPACISCGRFDGNVGAVFAPYGFSVVFLVVTTNGWYFNEGIDQGYDVSALVISLRAGTNQQLGDVTGYLGFCYLNCLQPAWFLTQHGYPSNYFGGNWQFEGQHLVVSDGRDYLAGSGAGPGSSGGPWISNIGTYNLTDSSGNGGNFPYYNILFSTTSWGFTSPQYKIQGTSTLSGPNNSNNWKGIFNYACNFAQSIYGSSTCGLLP